MTGYLHPQYAESLCEFGKPQPLTRCGGHLLARQIPNTDWQDAMGCYPVFCCQDWMQLHEDLEELASRMVSVALVADPMGNYDESLLRRRFDRVFKFKEHFIADLAQSVNKLAPKYHRKHARRALRAARIEVLSEPLHGLDDWERLYAHLVARHEIKGLRAFSRGAFAAQLQVPGMVAFRASVGAQTIGMHLWYVQGDAAYSHLSAYNDNGYDLRISYGLNWAANEHFAGKVRWLVLGAGAGTTTEGGGGLAEYKRGWSTGIRQVFFCGLTLNPVQYERLTQAHGVTAMDYFPAYRAGEFN